MKQGMRKTAKKWYKAKIPDSPIEQLSVRPYKIHHYSRIASIISYHCPCNNFRVLEKVAKIAMERLMVLIISEVSHRMCGYYQ